MPEYITIKDAAAALKLSTCTLYRRIQAGKINVVKFGRNSVRIERGELDRFIKAHADPHATREA